MLRKSAIRYEYVGEWDKFNEVSLPKKEEFYSSLNMEDITDSEYNYAKRVCNHFEIILKVIHNYWLMFLKTLEKLEIYLKI